MEYDIQSINDEIRFLESERIRIEKRLSVLRMKRDSFAETPEYLVGERESFNLQKTSKKAKNVI